ncbi:MAG: ATP-binding protein [Candidatus Pacebacteria bacterium]|jgi:hypothetical protein|nr:ATP-binding protein [Candidatus Paceibacterota bacterium]MDD4738296.1 ATP-binding protein [Candidatus Paceibacterota bacterium]
MITRLLQKKIEKNLFKGNVIIIYGARQVGKTTLVKQIIESSKEKSKYLNCEILSVQNQLREPEPEKLKFFLGDTKLVVLDEAQSIENIGLIIKVLIDTYPDMQIIATGSSSFDLANKVSEPLTGRALEFKLYPLSVQELKEEKDLFDVESKIEKLLIFGSYPEVFLLNREEAIQKIDQISSNYLFKDILSYEGLKKSSILVKLLKTLALQIGNEVNYNELSKILGIDNKTVEKYIDLLEKCFIVFKLSAFSRNLRKEISKSVKIYFYDLGIRNSLIQNYNPLDIRNDVGALWENFCIVEKIKKNHYSNTFANYYFWRTYTQKEIDFIEEKEGKLFAFEIKWKQNYKSAPREFLEEYKNSSFEIINNTNYYKFLS